MLKRSVAVAVLLCLCVVSVYARSGQVMFFNNGYVNITPLNVTDNKSVCLQDGTNCPAGLSGANNYPTSLSVTNGSGVHNITIGRNGLSSLLASFDDQTGGGGSGIGGVQASDTSIVLANASSFRVNSSWLPGVLGNFSGNASTWGTCLSGEYSRWNGTGFRCFVDTAGSGTVTSVATSAPITGGPFTTTGTIGFDYANFYSTTNMINLSVLNSLGYYNSSTLPSSLDNYQWRFIMPVGVFVVTNNSGVQLKAGTGMSFTNDTLGNLTIATTITQYTDSQAVSASAVANGNFSASQASYVNSTRQAGGDLSGTYASFLVVPSGINQSKLNSTNTAGLGQILTAAANGQFTWVSASAASGITSFNITANGTNTVIQNASVIPFVDGNGTFANNTGGNISYSLTKTGVAGSTCGSATNSCVLIYDLNGRLVNATNVAITGSGGSSAATNAGFLNSTNTVFLANNATNVSVGNNSGTGPNLFVDETNNRVGIGTSTPESIFAIQGTASPTILFVRSIVNGISQISFGGSQAQNASFGYRPLTSQFYWGAGTALTTSPAMILSTAGVAQFFGNVNASGLQVGTTNVCLQDGTNCQAIAYQSSAGGWVNTTTFISSIVGANISVDSNLTYFDALNNRVGIMVLNGRPTTELDVNGTINDSGQLYVGGGVNITGNSYIAGSQICTIANGLCTSGGSGAATNAGWLNSTNVVFLANNNTNVSIDQPANLFVDNTNNRVGIGTTTPGQKLEINGSVQIGSGNPSVNLSAANGQLLLNTTQNMTGLLVLNGANSTLYFFNGTNACAGVGTFSSGAATILTPCMTASSHVLIQDESASVTNVGSPTVTARNNGNFSVSSTNVLDSSSFYWEIRRVGP